MNELCKVIYFFTGDQGDMKITQNLTQKDLGKLLMNNNVVLVSVNAESKPYHRKKKKGR